MPQVLGRHIKNVCIVIRLVTHKENTSEKTVLLLHSTMSITIVIPYIIKYKRPHQYIYNWKMSTHTCKYRGHWYMNTVLRPHSTMSITTGHPTLLQASSRWVDMRGWPFYLSTRPGLDIVSQPNCTIL